MGDYDGHSNNRCIGYHSLKKLLTADLVKPSCNMHTYYKYQIIISIKLFSLNQLLAYILSVMEGLIYYIFNSIKLNTRI